MASVNKVILVGNLGADPDTRYLPSGDAVSNIRLATTDRWKDKTSGEMKELTGIAGNPPSLVNPPSGCLFAPRCQFATDECRQFRPELITVDGLAVRCHLVNPRVAK